MTIRFFINTFLLVPLLLLTCFIAPALAQKVNGTTGTPLGGFGAGAIKFNANTGSFAVMTQPPADAYDFQPASNARFRFYSERAGIIKTEEQLKAVITDKQPDDDAIWPLHNVNFGEKNAVKVTLSAFSPLDNVNYDNMSLPYAFYEVTLKNKALTAVNVSFSVIWNAGAAKFSYVKGKGISSPVWAVFAQGSSTRDIVSVGNVTDVGFKLSGKCSNMVNDSVATVAVATTIAAGEAKKLKFVIAWYDRTDPNIAYYKRLYKEPAAIANRGIAEFDHLKANAQSLVNRMRMSNLPDWLKNQTLNTLANISTNSMYKKDGRVGFAEGQWTCFGTMDQMWHARQIIGEMLPFFAWQELRYWARTQMKNGQIHHDFNKMDVGSQREKRAVLVDWDDTEHADYRNVDKWVDLNCAMIISTYEIYEQTGDKTQLKFLWPYLKKAGQRIFDQVKLYGNKTYPFTFDHSENSYDAGGDPDPFNANLSAVAYKVMTILADEMKEKELSLTYQQAFKTVVRSYEARYLSTTNLLLGKHCESLLAGQWLALHLKLGELWNAEKTDWAIGKLDDYYHPYYRGLGYPKGTYDEWTPYFLTHYGGLLLNTNRVNQWRALQKDAFDRQYSNRNLVFDHPLNILPQLAAAKLIATNYHSGNQYISMPALWRNYYDIIGFHRNRQTKELWVTPVLPTDVQHRLTNAMFISPEGSGRISCSESGKYFQNKNIRISTNNDMAVALLHLADNFGKSVKVLVNGKPMPFARHGSGYAKELIVRLNGKINKTGLRIQVSGDAGKPAPEIPTRPAYDSAQVTGQLPLINAYRILEAEKADRSAGTKIVSDSVRSYVSSCNNFDYIQFSNVDFEKSGGAFFYAKVASKTPGSIIEIVLDNVAGETIGSCVVPDTGGWERWVIISCALSKTKGIHDVFLRFAGTTSNDLMNIDKIAFKKAAENINDVFK